jgi:hypothetical protein
MTAVRNGQPVVAAPMNDRSAFDCDQVAIYKGAIRNFRVERQIPKE